MKKVLKQHRIKMALGMGNPIQKIISDDPDGSRTAQIRNNRHYGFMLGELYGKVKISKLE